MRFIKKIIRERLEIRLYNRPILWSFKAGLVLYILLLTAVLNSVRLPSILKTANSEPNTQNAVPNSLKQLPIPYSLTGKWKGWQKR